MKLTKEEVEIAKKKKKKMKKDISSPLNARMDHVDELWDEITEINKAISRIYNRLGLE